MWTKRRRELGLRLLRVPGSLGTLSCASRPQSRDHLSPTQYQAFTASIGMSALATVTMFTALLLDRENAPERLAFVLAAAVSIVAAIRLARVLHLIRLVVDLVITSRAREPGQ